ncbi:MAG: hypothetical protein JWQ43_1731 [Glaciihabitans sp.]|nr:hypothetical protein [Glaciihabitans sp.]
MTEPAPQPVPQPATEQVPEPENRPASVPWVAVTVFVIISFGLAWLCSLPLWLDGGLGNPLVPVLLPLTMFTPAVAALIVVLFVQRPRPRSIAQYLGVSPFRPARRIIYIALIGLFGSVLVSVLSVFLAAATGAIQLDLVNFSSFAQTINEQLTAAGVGSLPIPIGALVAIQLVSIPFAAFINSLLSVGEEIGWRGWLLPSLLPLGTWPALLASGALWGLWHSPLILLGYNFNQPNLLGVLMMTVGCTAYGVLIGWLRLRSGSVWPSVLAHGAFNASAGIGLLLLAAGSTPTAFSLLPLGWPGWVVCAVLAIVLVLTGQFRKQPSLVRKTAPKTPAATPQ